MDSQERRKIKSFNIIIESDLLRVHPLLAKILPLTISRENLNSFLNSVVQTSEMIWSIYLDTVRVSLKGPNLRGRTSFTGEEYLSQQVKDICDVIREETGVDPRKQLIYSGKDMVYGVHTDALKKQFMPKRKNPFDPISSEEIILRRQLAENHWNRSRLNDRQRKENNERQEKATEVSEYFFSDKKR
jgi:hypothetical protein